MATNRQFTAAEAHNLIMSSDSDENTDGADVSDDDDINILDAGPAVEESSEDDGNDVGSDDDDDADNNNSQTMSGNETEDYSVNEGGSDDDRVNTLLSKDKKTAWNTKPMEAAEGRRSAANVLRYSVGPGPTRYSIRNVDTPASAFRLFMRDNVLDEIQRWTNIEGSLVFGNSWKDLERRDLLCYIGLLLLAGVYKAKNEPVEQLWNIESGRPIFSKSMARNRFTDISRVLRFDNAADRRQRRVTDKLAPIREVFEMWEKTLEDAFVPYENVTVDEQLVTYRGRCPFKQYIPSKPGKYGIKCWMLSDSKTSYVCRLQVYVGRQDDQARERNQGERVVLDLCGGLKGSGRNITCDNFFTSMQLVQKLKRDKLTLLGTVRKNRVELPPEFVTAKGREALSSKFAFTKDAMIVSYCPKKSKIVVLMSSMHDQGEIDDSHPKKKPRMILEYNLTKGGVDTSDQMLRNYSCKRMTRRWPIAIFANMLDISALNAYIIWMLLNPDWNQRKNQRRRLFLADLGKVRYHTKQLLSSSGLPYMKVTKV